MTPTPYAVSGDDTFAVEWRPVVGWEDRYEVSSVGRVRTLEGKPIRISLCPDGYPRLTLSHGRSKRKTVKVHVLVAEAFIGPRPDGFHVCHNDGDKQNNLVSNLRFDTPAANVRDAVEHGVQFQSTKTHCPQGHEYSGENTTHVQERGWNSRRCKTCARERAQAYRDGTIEALKTYWRERARTGDPEAA